jgi:hypothetical protein
MLPDFFGEIFWRLFCAAAFLGGIGLWLARGVREYFPEKDRALFFILLLPISVSNLNNGQANFLLIGLLVCAFAAVKNARWWLAALCIAAATYLKIYPLVIGLLLAVVHPRRFSWRLLLALAGLGALTFLLQRPGYVLEQYRLWITTRIEDSRSTLTDGNAPHDLRLLLRALHFQIGARAYQAMQILSGAGVAALCLRGRLRKWPAERLLVALFSLGTAWITLCGPATESATYVLLTPFVLLALLRALRQPEAPWLRGWIVATCAVFLAGLVLNSFTHHRTAGWMSVQPVGSLLFLGYLVIQAYREPQFFRNPVGSLAESKDAVVV